MVCTKQGEFKISYSEKMDTQRPTRSASRNRRLDPGAILTREARKCHTGQRVRPSYAQTGALHLETARRSKFSRELQRLKSDGVHDTRRDPRDVKDTRGSDRSAEQIAL